MKSNPQIGASLLTPVLPPLVADPSEKRGDQAERAAQHWEQKRKVRCERSKAGKFGTFLNCYFLSMMGDQHVMHIVNNEKKPLKMDNCSCDTCSTPEPETIKEFVASFDGIVDFEILPLEDHPDTVVIIIDGQPAKEGLQIFSIHLECVVPRNCNKPVHQAIWKVAEEVRRRKGQ